MVPDEAAYRVDCRRVGSGGGELVGDRQVGVQNRSLNTGACDAFIRSLCHLEGARRLRRQMAVVLLGERCDRLQGALAARTAP